MLMAHAESLKHCPGWTKWLQPKVFAAYDKARDSILEAAARGEKGKDTDILLYQTFHALISDIRVELSTAEKRVGKPITFE